MVNKKNIFFFGCSQTAGDELADDDYFPWKKDCKTVEDYYNRKKKYFHDHPEELERYLLQCKEKSYPSLIPNINKFDFSRSGSSLRSNIQILINLVEKNDKNIDLIFFQIPPRQREFFVNNVGEIKTLRFHGFNEDPGMGVDKKKYLAAKLKSHQWYHQAIEDLTDILLLQNYLKFKSINHYFIDFFNEINSRKNEIPETFITFHHLKNLNLTNFLDLSYVGSLPKGKNLGYHFTESVHTIIANDLNKIIETSF